VRLTGPGLCVALDACLLTSLSRHPEPKMVEIYTVLIRALLLRPGVSEPPTVTLPASLKMSGAAD
jgi:hypothetical protein